MPEPMTIRSFDPSLDLGWASELLDIEFGGRMQVRRGEPMDALEGSGLVAARGPQRIGLVTWFMDIASASAEIRSVVLIPDARGQGLGGTVVQAAHDRLREAGARRAWLVTTNDNLRALALYQRLGYRLAALRAGAVDEARRTIKPAIPEIGEHGIPIRDELELEILL